VYGAVMSGFFAQCIIKSQTGASRDDNVSTFALDGVIPTLDASNAQIWVDAIKQFFTDMQAYGAMRGRATTGHRVKIYDIATPAPNFPIYDLPWSFAGANGALQLPPEVQLCVSFANTIAVTLPRARRRGRIYIGGWSEFRNVAGRPDQAIVDGLPVSYLDYMEKMLADTPFAAGVWSRSQADVFPLDTVHVDNEWDTMRSRGGRATSRTTVVLP